MDVNQQIIDTFRDNAGEVSDPPFGTSLTLVHVPKKDGSERVVPLVTVRDDNAFHIVGTAAGSPRHPAWVYGLRRSPQIDLEVPGDPVSPISVTVTELDGADRDRIWDKFVETSPSFADYLTTAEGRVFPVFRLDRA